MKDVISQTNMAESEQSMRTVKELLEKKIQCEDMSREEHISYINYWFDKYEKEGFSNIFCSPYDGESSRNGESFEVIGRVKAYSGIGEMGEDEAALEVLPMWKIKFCDGETMAAYPEEIIPSEIKDNLWRESDKHLIGQL